MDLRELRALELAARYKIAFRDGYWVVPSQGSPGRTYRVRLGENISCECEDWILRQAPCKHVIAARIVCARDRGGKAPAIDADAVPRRPTYKQDWPAYNLAQSVEKHRFQELLADLCRGIPESPPPKCGRRPHRAKDAVFAMTFKVYSTFSSRRFSCDLKDAHAKGYTLTAIPGAKVPAFFAEENYTPILQDLIRVSSLPLRAVETTFAPDSTGFSTSRFVRWFDEKYGCERSGHDWVKAHIMTGTKTNIITAAEIHGRDANDSPILPSLLKTTTGAGFDVREVPADKGYSSVENVEAITAVGATPFIAFKSNATGGAGGLWEKAFHFYSLHREDFLARYHQRSNVESTFSMVKAKFRDHVRSKTDAAMRNEVYLKLLCHNICCLIQSQCELGIEPAFWGDRPESEEVGGEAPAVLPLVRRPG
jgi:transposase